MINEATKKKKKKTWNLCELFEENVSLRVTSTPSPSFFSSAAKQSLETIGPKKAPPIKLPFFAKSSVFSTGESAICLPHCCLPDLAGNTR
ncbi:hypothetical protein L3Y34_004752 [Caenorhabditis briggsae]|uniref:Uncharacterized protein n=1 Tax=Caenorhabditis briggsae TaxID=6238 RepID=A0AAE9AEN1_CAEBR|nr:hypothetical protein L3Y34_004752 [Caenorhabditis briggsae]